MKRFASALAVIPAAWLALTLVTPTPISEGIPLGHTGRGLLSRRLDPRLGRWVLAEHLDAPLDDEGSARLGLLAAAGGPHVQRLLRIDDDGAIVFEALAAPSIPLCELPAAEAEGS